MKLALIGVGLIGGSFARALRAAGKVDVIVGFDSQPEAMRRAIDLGVIDQSAESEARAVEKADLVMIATPVGSVQAVLQRIAPHLGPVAIVTDVGSTKANVIQAALSELGSAFERFVPGHPIAGGEQSGVEHSDAALFQDKVFVATPVARTEPGAVSCVETLWRDVGCHVQHMTAAEHDSVFAAVSHLPHLLAFALVAHVSSQPDADRKFALAGAGFRDFTRIAASNPAMWRDICIANAEAISGELESYRNVLTQLQAAVDLRDAAALERAFTRSVAAR